MLKELESGDWEEAFKYAQSPDAVIGEKVALDGFTREGVAEVFNSREGENDEDSWLIWGRLHDGRFFYLEAWCDYTGWG